MSTLDVPTIDQHRGRDADPIIRLRVLVRRSRLDERLAAGEDAAGDPRLAVRARQLTRPAARARLAASLRDAVCSLDDSALAQYARPQIPVAAASVRACAWEIEELARALTGPNPHVRGVAIVRTLVTDGASPLYYGRNDGLLRAHVLRARCAL